MGVVWVSDSGPLTWNPALCLGMLQEAPSMTLAPGLCGDPVPELAPYGITVVGLVLPSARRDRVLGSDLGACQAPSTPLGAAPHRFRGSLLEGESRTPVFVEEDVSFPLATPGSQFVCLTPGPSSAFLAVSVVTSPGWLGGRWWECGVWSVECGGSICSSQALTFHSGAAGREVPGTALPQVPGQGWRESGDHGPPLPGTRGHLCPGLSCQPSPFL